jgi:hypothetical protein
MDDDQVNNRGYIICHQCITDSNKISRQMRPLDDWKNCAWYNEAKTAPLKKKKAPKSAAAKPARKKNKK